MVNFLPFVIPVAMPLFKSLQNFHEFCFLLVYLKVDASGAFHLLYQISCFLL